MEREHTLERLLVELYPGGPADAEIWSRSGGDSAQLTPGVNGRAAWHAALRLVRNGGGGRGMGWAGLLEAAAQDFPNRHDLRGLLDAG